MVKKSNWIKINSCYKKSIKKYNKCIQNNKCSKKKCEQKCWDKNKRNYKRCSKKKLKNKKGGSNTSGALLQLNVNSNSYKFPIFYFPAAMKSANNMNSGNNNTNTDWNKWYTNYIENNDPNSNFGSITLKESIR